MNVLHEGRERLWWLAAAPALWLAHLLSCYLTATIWCAKFVGDDGSLGRVRAALTGLTVVALAGEAIVGWIGYRRQGSGGAKLPCHLDTAEDRHRFLGLATLLLAGVSAVGTCYVALAAVFFRSCD